MRYTTKILINLDEIESTLWDWKIDAEKKNKIKEKLREIREIVLKEEILDLRWENDD